MRRSKVELFGLLERVIKLWEEGKTLQEIEQILRSEGYDISRESIRRKIKSVREVAEVYRKSVEEAKVLLEEVRNNPNTDVVEVVTSLLAHHLMNFTKSIESIDFDDPMRFVEAVRKLSDAQVRVAKLRLDYQKGFEAAKKEITDALARELNKNPELKEKLIAMISTIEARQ